ncbi:CGLD27 family protein [Leptolyngbya sp. FACHB-261]|uniref:CGLD27 family protein n=1 Tax=Leptolyngbya sp. FACHB-261 TaxID=2692806 RepID=UPI00168857DA|nr:CGLD27 family protein [Leptolyngbya sp. FACHB-261]MBD2100515.1 CGLD27 family protein [Leptolyngbya sp. FACHB-261]
MSQSSSVVCPVPLEQRPLNEYEELRESWFFSWATLDIPTFVKRLAVVWLVGWSVSAPVAAYSFSPSRATLQFLLFAAAGASLPLGLVLLRLYLGWNYIRSRLLNATIPYEESGWYDGQYWTKPTEELTKDRLVFTYQVQPLLRRLERTFMVLGVLLVLGVLAWSLT